MSNGPQLIGELILQHKYWLFLWRFSSERELELQIQMNIAYRWFLGLYLTDKVPHHSTISWNRRTRFHRTDFSKIRRNVLQG